MAGDDITVHVEWLARRLAQQQEDAVHVEWLARRLAQQQEDAAVTEQHRITAHLHRVSRVPGHVRDHNPDAYTPGLVAIGPLHAGSRLRAGDRLKMAYLNSLISRGHRDDPAAHLAVIQGYVRAVAAREREARAMYAAEDVDGVGAEEFVQMLVLDGCFILEHLVNVATGGDEQALHATPFGAAQVSVDLVLAENQIPFFVLVELMRRTRLPELDAAAGWGGYEHQPAELVMKLAQYYLAGEKGREMGGEDLLGAGEVCHLLHLLHAMVTAARTRWEWEPPPRIQHDGAAALRMAWHAAQLLQRLPLLFLVSLMYPTLPEESRWSARYGRVDVPPAAELKRMLMGFKARGGDNKSNSAAFIVSMLGPVPLAVRLVDGHRLLLPQLRIEFRTAPLLLNLMAFEQSAEQRCGAVSAYVWLMATLVQSAEDAGVLVAAEVVQSSTSGSETNDDVARFFRQVGAASEALWEVERSYLADTLQRLRERTSNQFLTKRADVQRYYVNVPWRLVAAFVIVVMTVASVLQTFASFKQKP